MKLPAGFKVGVATSSAQIEGAWDADGKGWSIWDAFAREPGRVANGDTLDEACDHWRRMGADVDLLRTLGVDAYRFSVAWPRVVPDGDGAVEPRGLDGYDRLVDLLLAAGVEPWVTLYHWDLPLALEHKGGWRVRDTAAAFARYAEIVGRRLGDRVGVWLTHNEPWCASMLGHLTGDHAPGRRSWPEALAASHHLLLSHGLAVAALRPVVRGRVGLALNLDPAVPASSSAADADAARRFDGWFNRWFLDPVFGRGYPVDRLDDLQAEGHLERLGRGFRAGGATADEADLAVIAAPIDVLGINYYNRTICRSDRVSEADNAPVEVQPEPPDRWTDMPWERHPASLSALLRRVHETWGPIPLAITENGAAYDDGPGPDGQVDDQRRVDFLHEHVLAALDAVGAGVPLEGYFAWSLLDNFEWAYGYSKRFGVVWVDFRDQRRVIKRSGRWLAQLARDRRVPSPGFTG